MGGMAVKDDTLEVSTYDPGDGVPGVIIDASQAESMEAFSPVPTFRRERSRSSWRCFVEAKPVPMMWLLQTLYRLHHDLGAKVVLGDGAWKTISDQARLVEHPRVDIDDKGRIIVHAIRCDLWNGVLRRSGASPTAAATSRGAVVPTSSARRMLTAMDALPRQFAAVISPQARAALTAPLPAPYDGTEDSLRRLPVDTLDYVARDAQPWADRKANGAPMAQKLRAMGMDTLHDLLVDAPIRYIDRSDPQDIRELVAGEKATVIGTIIDITAKSPRLTVITVRDHTGATLDCSFFNGRAWLERTYRVGDEVIVTGAYKPYVSSRGEYPQMSHPAIDFLDSTPSPVIPVYSQSGKTGVSSRMIQSCEEELTDRLGPSFRGAAWLEHALEGADLDFTPMEYGRALRTMHAPADSKSLDAASRSLAFCEMVQMLVIVEDGRDSGPAAKGVPGRPDGTLTGAWVRALPYELTDSQRHAFDVIGRGMADDTPMHALLVGDVGSGKTTVIHLAALASIEEGHQAVICAPTEILAQQLHDVFMENLSRLDPAVRDRIHVGLQVQRHGQGAAAERHRVTKGMADGSINLVFGTHAVFSKGLRWHDLGFVGIDEQHKFGADQRTMLLDARGDGLVPDMLMQTATPIPRSIAQVYYGDIHYLRLDHGPAGRRPIETKWIKRRGRDVLSDPTSPVWADIVSEARKGHGTFIICPMVEEGKVDAANVKETYATVSSRLEAKGVSCAMIYGSQDRDEQMKAIDSFRDGRTDVLVASSVVEVGVSCDHASRMLVLDANRFGLASLHQIRGRIGRSDIPSVCWLAAATYTQDATRRMEAMTSTLDGWDLSKRDLANRGTGTVLGDAQSGSSDFVFADLVRDAGWLNQARRQAKEALAGPDKGIAVRDSRRWFGMGSDDHIRS